MALPISDTPRPDDCPPIDATLADAPASLGPTPPRQSKSPRTPANTDPTMVPDTIDEPTPSAITVLPLGGGRSRYGKLRPLGKGGIGEVFVALDEEINREVALKEIQQRHHNSHESQVRFVLEAEVTGRLEHPGVVPVYGLGRYPDGRPYYAMRLIKGETFKDAIAHFHDADRPGRDPSERSLAFRGLLRRFIDVCNAVAYAHSKGILHRDLKADNVMLGRFGETLVIDWGLAKVLDASVTDSNKSTSLRQDMQAALPSGTGLSGTPGYMSPEQGEGRSENMRPSSDLYSLGAILYTLLAGQPPFASTSLGEMLSRQLRGEFPPPRRVKSSVPAALEAVCLRAMAL